MFGKLYLRYPQRREGSNLAVVLIEWKIKGYVYLVKAERLEIEAIPAEYQTVVAERLIAE